MDKGQKPKEMKQSLKLVVAGAKIVFGSMNRITVSALKSDNSAK